jgi:FkbM family methyltransferase
VLGITNIRGHSFFGQRLEPNCVIVDLGANNGEFSRRAKLHFDAQCISVEANRELADELQREDPQLNVMSCAISDSREPITFYVSADSEISSIVPNVSGKKVSPQTVDGKTLNDVIEENHLAQINLLKVDIEGAELPMIRSLSDETLDKIDQITMEFHDFTGAISKKDVTDMVKRLESAGFWSIKFSVSNKDWLFYRPDRLEIDLLQHLITKFILRNIYAVMRKLDLVGE